MDLPKILLAGLVFLVFLEFLGSWAWDSKNLEKNQINQKTTKKILNGLTQDSSHRIDFFYVDINLGILAMKKSIVEKQAKKQHMQKPNAPSVPFWLYLARLYCSSSSCHLAHHFCGGFMSHPSERQSAVTQSTSDSSQRLKNFRRETSAVVGISQCHIHKHHK